MEELPTILEKKEFTYRQLKRKKNVAIYQQQSKNWPEHIKYYEVIKIKKISDKEVYPRSSKWGDQGWTFVSYEEALKKYNALK